MPELKPGASPNARLLVGDMPAPSQLQNRWGTGTSVSVVTHVVVFLIIVFIATRVPAVTQAITPIEQKFDLTWLQQPGPGGGGGGGGNQMKELPRKVELPGKQKMTVPVTKIAEIEKPKVQPEVPKPDQRLEIPAQLVAQGVQQLPGVLQQMPTADTPSLGNGTGSGAGGGRGSGMGPGTGSGLGDGSGGGTGGGIYHPGNGVSLPILIKEVKPNYTGDAMRAKLQGLVEMEAVVQTDGSVGEVHIIRSLDPTFGLDEEAKKAVKQWRFRPGTLKGQPVPVLVNVELTFTLR